VAETITAAADPEANIIFGATINPDLEGEIIVTVVATGFDESYFATRDTKAAQLLRQAVAKEAAKEDTKIDDASLQDLDVNLENTSPAEDFHSEETPNIWALPEDDKPEAADEDELDKPSFLRRLTGRKQDKKPDLDNFGDIGDSQPTAVTDDSSSPADDDTPAASDDDESPLHGEKPEPGDDDAAGEEKSEKPAKKAKK
jgi:hypothetical protein